VRGDKSILSDEFESPTGVWVSNYAAKSIIVRNANVQNAHGRYSPFFRADQSVEPGRGDGSVIMKRILPDYVGVVVATAYSSNAKKDGHSRRPSSATRSSSRSTVPASQANPPAAISMNYRMAPAIRIRATPSRSSTSTRKPATTSRCTIRSRPHRK
jgi:hypothetical protein